MIEGIGLKSTRIRAYTGELRIISNRQLLDKEIQNITVRDHIRIGFTIGVAYETPPDLLERVPAILREIVETEGGTVARAGFETFGASSIDLSLLFDVPGDDWNKAHPMRDRIVVSIMRRFAQEGISIPIRPRPPIPPRPTAGSSCPIRKSSRCMSRTPQVVELPWMTNRPSGT